MLRSTQVRRGAHLIIALAVIASHFGCGPSDPGSSETGAGGVSSSTGGTTAGGGEGNTGTGSSTALSSGGNGVGGSGDGQGDGGGSPGGGASGGGGTSHGDEIGSIQVIRRLALGSGADVGAFFDAREPASGAVDCTRTTYGECRLSLCPPTEEPPGLLWDAGVITIHDNDSGADAFTATLIPSGETGSYAREMSGTLTGGELLAISAQGGSVSGFERTVQLPLAPLLLSHPVSEDGGGREVEIPVPRTVDLEISLDMRDTGATVHVLYGRPSSEAHNFSCAFEQTPGQGVIPAEALLELPAGSRLYVLSGQNEMVETPEGRIRISTAFEMTNPERTAYPVFVLE